MCRTRPVASSRPEFAAPAGRGRARAPPRAGPAPARRHPPYTSASASIVRTPSPAISLARLIASDVRPGAPGRTPDGDQRAGARLSEGGRLRQLDAHRQRRDRSRSGRRRRSRRAVSSGAGSVVGVDRRLRPRPPARPGAASAGTTWWTPKRVQPLDGRMVARRHHPDHGHAGRAQTGHRVAVEPTQIGRQHDRLRLAGARGRQQVRKVDAPSDHGQRDRAVFERGDEVGLPNGLRSPPSERARSPRCSPRFARRSSTLRTPVRRSNTEPPLSAAASLTLSNPVWVAEDTTQKTIADPLPALLEENPPPEVSGTLVTRSSTAPSSASPWRWRSSSRAPRSRRCASSR